jgi:antitoxin PrlF
MHEQMISTLTSKSQTVIPKEIRQKMGLKPGDHIRYRVKGDKVEIEKLNDTSEFDPFSSFTEWSSPADEQAFSQLRPPRE